MPLTAGQRKRRRRAAGMILAAALGVVAASWAVVRAHARDLPGPPRRTPLPLGAVGDRGDLCADVGVTRACWGPGLAGPSCAGGACRVDRAVPSDVAAPLGWRCAGWGSERACEGRAQNAGPFDCDRGSCVQHEVRMPDDDEWDCVDVDGVVYCRSTARAAGVARGRRDLGWLCGPRKAGKAGKGGKGGERGERGKGERICVDLSPDRPAGDGWRCGFQYAPELVRVCKQDARPGPESAKIGDRCDALAERAACPRDATCVDATCLPMRPAPGCWLDADCGDGAHCRWGTCASGAP